MDFPVSRSEFDTLLARVNLLSNRVTDISGDDTPPNQPWFSDGADEATPDMFTVTVSGELTVAVSAGEVFVWGEEAYLTEEVAAATNDISPTDHSETKYNFIYVRTVLSGDAELTMIASTIKATDEDHANDKATARAQALGDFDPSTHGRVLIKLLALVTNNEGTLSIQPYHRGAIQHERL